MTTIPIEQTITLGGMTPVTFALLLTDMLHLYRPTGGSPADYEVTVEQLRDFFTANMLAVTDVTDSLVSTDTQKPGSANQLRILKDLIDALDGVVAGKLDASAYNQHYRGTFTGALQLQTTIPAADAGDYALVDPGAGFDAKVYVWDTDDAVWVEGANVSGLTTDGVVEGSVNLYFTTARAIAAAADAYIRYDEPQLIDSVQANQFLDNLNLLADVQAWRLAGQIRKWEPFTDYNAAPNGGNAPPNLVWHDDQLYLVLTGFSSGSDFEERIWPLGRVLSRVAMSSDPEYNEITANGTAPLTVGQELGSYLFTRGCIIRNEYVLPRPNVNNNPVDMHRLYTNVGLSGNLVVTIKRLNRVGGIDTIGTVTVVPDGTGDFEEGVFEFNDSAAEYPTQTLLFVKGDCLIFELTTVPSGLTWIRLNMLGKFENRLSGDYNLPS